MKANVTLKISNCLDCPHHRELPESLTRGEPRCSDRRVLCARRGRWHSIVQACHPDDLRASCKVPHWCRLRPKRDPSALTKTKPQRFADALVVLLKRYKISLDYQWVHNGVVAALTPDQED